VTAHDRASAEAYPIYELSAVAAMGLEPMGSKRKFWHRLEEAEHLCLFKYAQRNTGEDWAEKIAAEAAAALGVPHARVELAACEGDAGALSFRFLGDDDRLVHGNELLQELDPSYPLELNYRASRHTVEALFEALRRSSALPPRASDDPLLTTAADWALGYLLLDALLGNTDRHHENWAVIEVADKAKRRVELAPSYDHASSLGRELGDHERLARLAGRDGRRTVQAYAERARSALYRHPDDRRPLSPIDAFLEGTRKAPARASTAWISRLRALEDAMLHDIVRRIPPSRMTPPAKHFAAAVLACNRRLLLERAVGLP
jgi:HipA-like C-terminal domain